MGANHLHMIRVTLSLGTTFLSGDQQRVIKSVFQTQPVVTQGITATTGSLNSFALLDRGLQGEMMLPVTAKTSAARPRQLVPS